MALYDPSTVGFNYQPTVYYVGIKIILNDIIAGLVPAAMLNDIQRMMPQAMHTAHQMLVDTLQMESQYARQPKSRKGTLIKVQKLNIRRFKVCCFGFPGEGEISLNWPLS